MAPAGKCQRKRGEIQAVMEERMTTAEVSVSNFGSVKRLKVEHDVDRTVHDEEEYALNSSSMLTSVLSSSGNLLNLTCRGELDNDYETRDLKVKFHCDSFAREINRDVIHDFSKDTTSISEISTETNEMDSLPTSKKSSTGLSLNFNTPTATEIDEFFSAAEKANHIKFMNKYNFDVVKDIPLSGRYEWVQIKP